MQLLWCSYLCDSACVDFKEKFLAFWLYHRWITVLKLYGFGQTSSRCCVGEGSTQGGGEEGHISLWDRESSSCITKSNNNKTLDTSERKRFLGCCVGSDRDEWLCLPGLLQEMPKGEGLPSQVISPIGSCALRWFFLWHRSFVWMLKRWTGLQLHQSADDRKLFSHFIQHRRVCISCFSIWGLGIGKLSLALRQTGVMLVRGESL